MKKLKVLELKINPDAIDNTGVDCISLVDSPAIEKDFHAFNKDNLRFKFNITDTEKHIVTGPIMVPDTYIYRNKRDDQGNIIDEWYVYASSDTITQVIQKFFKTQRVANTSLEHDGQLQNGVYLIESFQIDKKRGIQQPIGYGNIPEGTWFGSMKVDDPQVWAAIKGGAFNGFSVEGLFNSDETGITVTQPEVPAGVIQKYSVSEYNQLRNLLSISSKNDYLELNDTLTNI